ncbi:MAG: hypothetical protein COA50_16660 [Flavobacteriaceae bacterium]|nr:MAG: hypothetical protein COA50_16660 [Flavobacteriaceae bacterium]
MTDTDNYQFIIVLIILIIVMVGFSMGLYTIIRNINHPLLSLHEISNDKSSDQSPNETLHFPADGNWHNIISNLSGLTCLQIIATANGRKGLGKHSIINAQALNAFGKGKITINQTFYGRMRWTRLSLRWKRNKLNYSLQIKTRHDYGDASYIQVFLKKLYQSEQTSQI